MLTQNGIKDTHSEQSTHPDALFLFFAQMHLDCRHLALQRVHVEQHRVGRLRLQIRRDLLHPFARSFRPGFQLGQRAAGQFQRLCERNRLRGKARIRFNGDLARREDEVVCEVIDVVLQLFQLKLRIPAA
jgi:hypothetical protein